MRKISETTGGDIIAQMTQEEWGNLQTDIITWKSDFRSYLLYLDLRPRVRNCLDRALGYQDNIVKYPYAFTANGSLLNPDEWCRWVQVQEGKNALMRLRNFGEGCYEDLIKAIKSS